MTGLDGSQSLVEAVRRGEAGAADALLAAAWPTAYRIARAMLYDRAAAEDAAQEACARALDALATLRRTDRFVPWFCRIVANEAKRRLRTVAREVPLDGAAERALASVEADVDSRLDVRRAIDALAPELRTAIVLRYYFGLTSVEIGRILATSPVTARWRLMVAHRRLRAVLDPAVPPDFAVAERACR